MEFGEDDLFIFCGRVVGTFEVDLQETVEEDLGRLDGEFLAPAVGSDLDVGAEYAGVGHLGSDGPLPDEGIELALLRRTFDIGILNIGRTDGLVGFLGALAVGLVLADLGILLAVVLSDELLGRIDSQAGEVGRVGTHVGDQTAFIQLLGDVHGRADREVQLAGGLLLEGGRRERGGRETDAFLALDVADGEGGSDAVLQEFPCILQSFETGIQGGFHRHVRRRSFRMEEGVDTVVGFFVECHDLAFPVDDQPQGDALDAAGAELRLDLAP